MKAIQWLIVWLMMPVALFAMENEHEKNTDVLEIVYCKAVDNLFDKAQESLAAKENIITVEWLKCKEMEEIKNIMSDVSINLDFNVGKKKVVTEKLQGCLDQIIRRNVDKVFEKDEADNDTLRQFLYLSRTVCKLSEGTGCSRMMRIIKDDSFPLRQYAKTQKKARQQVKKEEMRRLCKIVELGALPREEKI